MKARSLDRLRLAIVLLSTLAVAASALAATPPPAASPPGPSPKEQMAALQFLVGEWEGEAWSQMGKGPREISQVRELVEWKIDGELLLLQGRGTQRDAATGAERVVHEAMAVVAWDPGAQKHVMWTYRAGAAPTIPQVTVGDDTVVWGFDTPRGKVRFTMRLDEQGRWVESGEYSADGAKWTEFLGMTLSRRGPAAAR